MTDKFEDLRTYVAIVESGGINAAAEALGIAKSAVSRRLGELETRLGVTLIERTTRRFELTEHGREYHRGAIAVLASLDELDDGVGSNISAPTPITICAEQDIGPRLVASALASFRIDADAYVDLAVGEPGTSDRQSYDIWIKEEGRATNGREARRIGEFDRVLCAAPSYLAERGTPTTLKDLTTHACISITGATWRFDAATPRKLRPVMVVPSAEMALIIAIAGAGLVQLPDFVAREAIDDGRLTSVLDERRPRSTPVEIVYAANCTGRIKRLVEHLAAAIQFNG